jgi:HEPN superfamily RES-like protein/RES domain-containing protein
MADVSRRHVRTVSDAQAEEDRVFSLGPGAFICADCIGEAELQAYIEEHAVSHACSFCNRSTTDGAIAADAEEVAQYMADCIGQEYQDAANEVAYESREGGYQADWHTTDDLFFEIGIEPTNEKAYDYLVRSLPDYAWVQQDFYRLHPLEALRFGWRGFTETIKHRTRYLFFERMPASVTQDTDDIRPEQMLRVLGRLIRKSGLVKAVPAGTLLYRVRAHRADEAPTWLSELGPPPVKACRSANRMSPAGISMLYTAEDEATAVAETIESSMRSPYTVATLRLDSDLRVVDFVDLPERAGIFTPNTTRESRVGPNFINALADDLSKPIARDGIEHIEYVPTQVVTEYIRFRFRHEKKHVHGIRHRSSVAQGGVNLALFAGHRELNDTSPWREVPDVRVSLVGVRRVQ